MGLFRSVTRMRHALWLLALVICTTLCSAPLRAQGSSPTVTLQDPLTGFDRPLFLTHAGDGSGRLFVLELQGRVRIVKNGQLLPTPFIDISDRVLSGGERGLLGIAFPPNYETSGYFYLYYTARAGDGDITLSRFSVSANADQADAASEQQLLTIEHSANGNHNGGMLAFGPRDGYLYIGVGDGGGGNDPPNNAQNPAVLLGKLLRIDVSLTERRYLPLAQRAAAAGQQAGTGEQEQPQAAQLLYSIPPSNPFVNRNGYRPEIWALGLRNPWRFSFDRTSGDLYIGDVGQGNWEEIDVQAAGFAGGANYGWRVVEGPICNPAISTTCDTSPYVAPSYAYDHSAGDVSVTGGYVYRGTRSPALSGIYIFGDFGSGRLWSLQRVSGVWQRALLLDTPANISSFGEDEAGEVYLINYSGTIYRVAGQ